MKSPSFPLVLIAAVVFIAVAAPAPLSATGTIKGKVTDSGGQPLSGVKITLLDETRGQTYDLNTDKKGNYFMMGIAPADYKLKVEKAGFQVLEGRVTIMPGRENVYDAVLAATAPPVAKPEWEGKNLLANELFKQGKYDEAAAAYRDILATNPALAAIHFNLGNCAYNLERYDEAVAYFKDAVRLKPDFFEAYTNLANAYGKLKKFDEAIPIFEEAARAHPENGRVFSALGLLYLNTGQGAKAVENLETAAALQPDEPFTFYSLGIAHTQAGAYAKAIAAYEKYIGLTRDPREVERVKGIIEQLRPLIKTG